MDRLERPSAADRPSRSIERGEETIACGVYLMSTVVCQLASRRDVVRVEEITPRGIADSGGVLRRADQIEERHRRQESLTSDSGWRSGHELLEDRQDRLLIDAEVRRADHVRVARKHPHRRPGDPRSQIADGIRMDDGIPLSP
jgi:hypothetical protein